MKFKNILLNFRDWWIGQTHWWRPRTSRVKCDMCGHCIGAFFRKQKCFFYDKNNRSYNICSMCDIPTDKVDRMYVSDINGCHPANDNALKFEIERAGQNGSLFYKKELKR